MSLIKCENGHFYDSDEFLNCPHCDGTYIEKMVEKTKRLFIWKDDYSVQKMVAVKITSGDLPIKNILWNGETVTYYNRINGSRDGGLQFDDDFFDETVIQLSADERAQIISLLCSINFSKWKTAERTIELVALGAAGFCPTDTFECEFESGEQFYCYPSYEDEFGSQLHNLFHSVEEIVKPKWKEYHFTPSSETILIAEPLQEEHFCTSCGSKLRENAQFCSACGKNTQGTQGETALFCPVCHGSFHPSDTYCPDCGVKVKYFTDVEKPQDEEGLKDAVYAFEKLIEAHQKDENDNWVLSKVLELLNFVPLFFAVEMDTSAILGDINPLSLKPGDTLTLQQNVKAKILTFTLVDTEVIPAFTKGEYADTSVMRFYPADYIDLLIGLNKPLVINLMQDYHFVVPVHYFEHMKHRDQQKTHLPESNVCSACGTIIPLNDFENLNFCPQCDAPLDSPLTEEPAQEDFNIGKTIGGRYKIISELQKRGVAYKRYFVQDSRLNKNWEAIEFPKGDFSLRLSPDILKRLDCFGIPRIVDIIEQGEKFYLLQTPVEGISLWDIVHEKGPQPESVVHSWGVQICRFLEYFYTFTPKIVHRDIKPQILFLDNNGYVHLTDLSIAMVCDERDIETYGTLGFAAPEQFSVLPIDCRADIFGFGRTMLYLLIGVNPAQRGIEILPIRQYNDTLSKGMEYIVEKCIQLDPNLRYQTPAQLLYDLEHITELPPKKGWFKRKRR